MDAVTVKAEQAERPALSRWTDADLGRALLIRHFERRLLDLFAEGLLSGTTHTCLGQEYVPVALAPLLSDDHVFSNHRGHGHYLARFDDPAGLLAEIMGRQGAVCRGVGGSQHIFRDGYLSTGVQGQGVPVATGVALHFRRTGEPRVAAAFVGDGTWGQGVVYEALNMAQLWRVPLLLVVENNGIAQSTPTAAHLAGTIGGRARAFGVAHQLVRTNDINAIRREVAPFVADVRRSPRPGVLEFVTRRLGPHSKGDDPRDTRTLRRLSEDDWYGRYRQSHPEQLARVEAEQLARLADVVREVSRRGATDWPDE